MLRIASYSGRNLGRVSAWCSVNRSYSGVIEGHGRPSACRCDSRLARYFAILCSSFARRSRSRCSGDLTMRTRFSTTRPVPARHGAPAPRGRRATMDAANTFARHCVVAAPLPAVFACGPAPLFVRWSRWLLLSADRAQSMGPAQSGRRVGMKPHARCNAHPRRTALRAIPMDTPASRPRPHRCSISPPTFLVWRPGTARPRRG